MAETANLGAPVGADGARGCQARAGNPDKGHGPNGARTLFRFKHGDMRRTVALKRRVRLTLLKFLAAGRHGISAHDSPVGARLAQYVRKLHAAGLPIETEMEAPSGEFPGVHARYRRAPGVRIRAEVHQ